MMPRWVKPAIGAGIVLLGWVFIAWQNRFHVTPPLVFVCIGYLAVVLTIYNLWRVGAAVASTDDAAARASWGRPVGQRTQLEREKKTLLKAIKEAEFDLAMGKLSKVDADRMVGVYRARAIEIIKALEAHDDTGTVREKIEREVKARLEIEGKTRRKAEVDAEAKKQRGKQSKKKQSAPVESKPEETEQETPAKEATS